MENIQYKNFIKLISAYINSDYNNLSLNAPDWEEIYRLAYLHSLGGLLYLSLTNSGLCDNQIILDKFKQIFLISATKSMVQEATTLKLLEILNKNKIRHIIFKGLALKNYYPNKEVRTMGDIDIIIDKENQQKVHDLLVSGSFVFDEFASHRDVRNYCKNSVCFEIHTKLIESNIFENVDLIGYFKNCFDKTVLKSNFTYEFSPENHFIYLIAHMAKHFKTSGCGVRMFLDLAVFIKYFEDVLDWNYISNELKTINLYNFADIIFYLCGKWFDMKVSFSSLNKSTEDIEDYIMSGGIFGYENKNYDALRINQHGESFFERIINLLKLIFPKYEHLKSRYVWVENTPKWLLPILWIKYWCFRIFNYKENPFLRIKEALKNNDDAKRHNEILKNVGL